MLDSLHIKNFRCFEDLTIPSLGRVNLIVGKNNSGKSTLLEAIYLYAKVANTEAIKALMDKRGDSDIGDTALDTIFHNKNTPTSYKERLEIGEVSSKSCLIITSSDSESRGKINDLIDQVKFNLSEITLGIHKGDFIRISSNATFLKNSPFATLRVSNLRQGELTEGEDVVFYSPSYIENENKLADLWDQVFLNTDDSALKEALQIIESNIVNMGFIPASNSNKNTLDKQRIAVVKLKGVAKAIPIKRLGDGMSRLLQIFLYTLQAKSGFLLLDEFENGLHYSIQQKVWEKLFKLAKELDIQVFATTHSEDAIKSFCKVALKSEDEQEARLISLGRSVGKSDYGKIFATIFDRENLELISNTGIEVR
jgi:AAA15 family ATPase/GTPase